MAEKIARLPEEVLGALREAFGSAEDIEEHSALYISEFNAWLYPSEDVPNPHGYLALCTLRDNLQRRRHAIESLIVVDSSPEDVGNHTDPDHERLKAEYTLSEIRYRCVDEVLKDFEMIGYGVAARSQVAVLSKLARYVHIGRAQRVLHTDPRIQTKDEFLTLADALYQDGDFGKWLNDGQPIENPGEAIWRGCQRFIKWYFDRKYVPKRYQRLQGLRRFISLVQGPLLEEDRRTQRRPPEHA